MSSRRRGDGPGDRLAAVLATGAARTRLYTPMLTMSTEAPAKSTRTELALLEVLDDDTLQKVVEQLLRGPRGAGVDCTALRGWSLTKGTKTFEVTSRAAANVRDEFRARIGDAALFEYMTTPHLNPGTREARVAPGQAPAGEGAPLGQLRVICNNYAKYLKPLSNEGDAINTATDVTVLFSETNYPFFFNIIEGTAIAKIVKMYHGDLSEWDVSNVTDMGSLFERAHTFNGDLSRWNVSNVTNMEGMFTGAFQFNGDLSKWDVSNVTNMDRMFWGAKNFNGDLSEWDVSNVTSMESMFESASKFNQDLSRWDVSNVTNMEDMFRHANSYRPPFMLGTRAQEETTLIEELD